MTDEPTAPDMPEDDSDAIADALLEAMMRGEEKAAANPKPDTASGVGAMIEATAQIIDDRQFARPGFVTSPEGEAIPAVLKPGGAVEYIPQETFDKFSDNPRWRRGTATMTSLDSFIAHVARFGDDDSAVFADDSHTAPSLTAVLDYHRKDTLPTSEDEFRVHGDYRHGKHRTRFAFPVSDQWQAWHACNAAQMNMAQFSIFLENNVLDVAEINAVPEGAKRFVEMNGGTKMIADWSTLTALAKTLTIYENSTVSEAVNLSSGEGQLTLQNAHDTEVAGTKVKVPSMFFIEIPIFREGVAYRLPVRLRYRKSGVGVTFWYELYRADRAFDDAFREAVERVSKETEAQVFFGTPEA